MPDLNLFPVPEYQANQPYHWEYDNLPLQTLATRDEVINGEVDRQGQILRDGAGTQGTISNRISQSIDADGNLIPMAIDQALHSIAEHQDLSKMVTPTELSNYIGLGYPSITNPVPFVRMLQAERDKLALIDNNATNMTISVETPSNIVLFQQGPVAIASSASIHWEVDAPNTVKAVLAVSTDFAHRHFYDLVPITVPSDDMIPVLYKKFKVNMLATPFIADSLRVYINGVRLSAADSIYYPDNSSNPTWSVNKFTPDEANGVFVLDLPISMSDIIVVDFDQSLT